MVTNDIGNTSPATAPVTGDDAEFDAFFEELIEEFGPGTAAGGSEYDVLNAALVGTDLEVPMTETTGMSHLFAIADGAVAESGAEGEAEIFGFIRNRFKKEARRAMKKLVDKIKSASKFTPCIPAVLKVVAAVKSGKWGTAIREAVSAWRCINSK